jgi:hypothetical protein
MAQSSGSSLLCRCYFSSTKIFLSTCDVRAFVAVVEEIGGGREEVEAVGLDGNAEEADR